MLKRPRSYPLRSKMTSRMYVLMICFIAFEISCGQDAYTCNAIADEIHVLENGPATLKQPGGMSNANFDVCFWVFTRCIKCTTSDEFLGYDKRSKKISHISQKHKGWSFSNESFPCEWGITRNTTTAQESGFYRMETKYGNGTWLQPSNCTRLHFHPESSLHVQIQIDNAPTTFNVSYSGSNFIQMSTLQVNPDQASTFRVQMSDQFPSVTNITITKSHGKPETRLKCDKSKACEAMLSFDSAVSNGSVTVRIKTGLHGYPTFTILQPYNTNETFPITSAGLEENTCTTSIVFAWIVGVLFFALIAAFVLLVKLRGVDIHCRHRKTNDYEQGINSSQDTGKDDLMSNTEKDNLMSSSQEQSNGRVPVASEVCRESEREENPIQDVSLPQEQRTLPQEKINGHIQVGAGSDKTTPGIFPFVSTITLDKLASHFKGQTIGFLFQQSGCERIELPWILPFDFGSVAINNETNAVAFVTLRPCKSCNGCERTNCVTLLIYRNVGFYNRCEQNVVVYDLGKGYKPRVSWTPSGEVVVTFVDNTVKDEPWYIITFDVEKGCRIRRVISEIRDINDVIVDHAGNIYCCDSVSDGVHKYKANGGTEIRLVPRVHGKIFTKPRSVCIHNKSELLVLFFNEVGDKPEFMVTNWELAIESESGWKYKNTLIRIPPNEDPKYMWLHNIDGRHCLTVAFLNKAAVYDITTSLTSN